MELQRAIKSREWRHAGASVERRSAGFGQVRSALAQSSAQLLMIFQVDGLIQVLPISSRSHRLTAVGRSGAITELAQRVRADLTVLANTSLPEALRQSVRRSLDRSLGELDDTLIRPLRLGDGPLVIVPTGALGLLPWGMLPSLKGVPVTVAPSATSWLRSRERARSTGREARVVSLAGPQLDHAGEEATQVAAARPTSVARTGATATAEALRSALHDADIVHVAAHGRHDSDSPLFSSIYLADGQIFGYDMVGAVGVGVHVVLSACDLGLATIRPGDEPLGLTHALLHSGAASVISSVARIEDRIAADVMTGYHQELVRGVAPAQALAAVTDLEVGAPFVCFGSGID
jgi:CHAT domain-containing protein